MGARAFRLQHSSWVLAGEMEMKSALIACTMLGMCLIMSLAAGRAQAGPPDGSSLRPSSLFIQAGAGDNDTRAFVAGATWDWPWGREFSHMKLSAYFEAGVGRWTTEDSGVSSWGWVTQIGVTPVLRLQPSGAANRWFGEVGVGANYIVPIYQSQDKRFSTQFNFGDHVSIGRQYGQRRQHELLLRLQHFSNAGIAHPNPGENFIQLRYARRL
jgi:hypothetical protein